MPYRCRHRARHGRNVGRPFEKADPGRFPEYQDQPKSINQNLSLMSPEQREEEAGRILLRIAALGIPLTTIDGEAIDISDIEAEVDPAAMPKKP